MKRFLAVLAIGTAGVIPLAGPQAAAVANTSNPAAHASCMNARTPGGVKCLQAGEYCSHKAGYAAAYRAAGYKCNANGRLEEI
ncbi:MAG: hypothetical protein JST53_01650 [Actinobacteria bacterium]|nr:hypothetical protein [Actinomycetota bacterium]